MKVSSPPPPNHEASPSVSRRIGVVAIVASTNVSSPIPPKIKFVRPEVQESTEPSESTSNRDDEVTLASLYGVGTALAPAMYARLYAESLT